MMPVASFVALLVAAVEALSMMVPTFVFITVVVAAIVSLAVMMAVVVALGIGIILQRAIRQSLRSCIGRTGNAAVKEAITLRTETRVGGITFVMRNGMLFITLPSGRRLSYVKPRLGENRFGGESVTYMGIDATKHWSRIESYGPKFVENIVQAVSRDILAYAMRTLSYCQIVGHVHDELIIECSPGVFLDAICEQMGRTPSWLPGIELRADGYECDYYMKQ